MSYDNDHIHDIHLIGEKLLEIAEREQFCSQFDEMLHNLNEQLHIKLPTRVRRWEIVQEITVVRKVVVDMTHDHAYSVGCNPNAAWWANAPWNSVTVNNYTVDEQEAR